MTKPLVSFVIPVLNGENDIARCLRSIQDQKGSDGACEVLIIDNGSTDHTPQIIRELGFDFQVIPDINVSALRNRGAMMAQGDYVGFVDADVELSPFWLQHALATFKDPKVVACGGPRKLPQNATWVQQTWELHLRGRRSWSKPTAVPWLFSMALIVRQDDFLAVSGFNESLKSAEDVDLCYRLGQRGTILYNPALEAVHWGEDPDLRTFWRKEVWRGVGNLRGVLEHGFRWDELPSLGYPLYVLCLGLLFGIGMGVDFWRWQILFAPLCLVLLALPATLLALHTTWLTRQPRALPRLFLLYFVYGFARAYSVVKTWAGLLV